MLRSAPPDTAASGRPRRLRGALPGLLALVALLPGCAALGPSVHLPDVVERPVLLEEVVFHPQTEFHCGPASLATVLDHSGVDADPDALAPQVYLPEREGSLQVELLGATRRAGRIPYVIDRDPAALVAELEAGRPVLVMQNLRTPVRPVWHYAVVTGVDPARNRFILNTDERQALPVRAPGFMRTWNWANRWAFVVLAPGEMPAQADPVRYAEAVADFERVAGGEAGATAWRAALLRWPHDHRPRLALGNLAYGQGDREQAAALYGEGLRARPLEPVLSNNLATVLGELGCADTARGVAGPALAALEPDSPWAGRLQATLDGLPGSGADGADCARWTLQP